MNGFGQDAGARGGAIACGEGDSGESGDEHDAQAAETGGRLAGDLDAVHARHDDVGEEQVPFPVVQGDQRLLAVGARPDLISRTLEGARKEASQGIVVFSQEDARHGCLMLE